MHTDAVGQLEELLIKRITTCTAINGGDETNPWKQHSDGTIRDRNDEIVAQGVRSDVQSFLVEYSPARVISDLSKQLGVVKEYRELCTPGLRTVVEFVAQLHGIPLDHA